MTAAIVSAPQLEPPVAGDMALLSGSDTDRPVRQPYLAAVPVTEPPFDDEAGPSGASTDRRPVGRPAQRTDPVAAPTRTHRAVVARQQPLMAPRTGARVLAVLPAPPVEDRPTTIAATGVPSWSSESDIGVRKTATEHLPSAERTSSVLARALVEVLSGHRPLPQLRVHCAPNIYAGLAARPSTGPLALPHLLTVRVCEPADGIAEVSAAFRRADRVRALAFRLEGVDGRWRITALQLG